MMHLLALWVSKRRGNAIIAAALLATLPYVAILSVAVIALTTLRQGTQQGLTVMLSAAGLLLGGALVAQIAGLGLLATNLTVIGGLSLLQWIPVLALAVRLGHSRSLSLAVKVAVGVTLLIVAGAFLASGDPAELWEPALRQFFAAMAAQSGAPAPGDAVTAYIARYATGFIATSWLLNVLVALFLGRWWQAMLDSPGQFGREYRALHLGRVIPLVAGAVFLGSVVVAGDFVRNLLIVCVFGLLLQGLAVVHCLLPARRWRVPVLVMLYIAIAMGLSWFVLTLQGVRFMPGVVGIYLTVAVVMVGFADCLFNFRARVAR